MAETTNQSGNEGPNIGTEEDNEQETNDAENNVSLLTNDIKQFKTKYLQVSDWIFKRMLLNAVAGADKIVQCLDTDEKLQSVRRMAEIINDVHYFDLQRRLWEAYYNIGKKENIWASSDASTSHANPLKKNQIYFLPKHLIEKRLKTIARQKQRTINELQEYAENLQRNAQQWQPSIDIHLLFPIVTAYVKNGQQRLEREFQYKVDIAELDLHDRRSTTQFYDLKPTGKQICLTKKYWQTIANELRTQEETEKLRKRIFLQRIPSKINRIIDQSMDHIQPMLSNSVLDKDRRAGLTSSYSKAITQYKFDLMSINLNTLESIRRGHQQQLIDLKAKLSQSCTVSLIEAITNREKTMRKRHEKFLEHTLETFFDEAPTASNE